MKKLDESGFTSRGYVAPRAESVAIAQESILCASPVENVATTPYDSEDLGDW